MIEQLYDLLLRFIDLVMSVPLSILDVLQDASAMFDGTSYSGVMDIFLEVLPTLATYSVFWFDQNLFPDYFGVALGFYVSCVVISMALKIIRAVLFFL